MIAKYGEDLSGKTFALWGLSFKPRTDDVREAPALYIIKKLTSHGAKIVAYDPIATETAKRQFDCDFEIASSAEAACEGATALLIVTEWNEFRNPDFDKIGSNLQEKIIFDGRNALNPKDVLKYGFEYYCIGRQSLFAART